ncbi:endopeptidase La [Catonella massiliensis]|uniref:Lon protease n=1 Tax=Catonella massiliensis TaxID=2799636 RepID=A0ABS1IZV6_9FIRM|nr:endopeptidase La [Catonella massiliensis]MBK5897421.1 endopeptidase La [Catonella massiliensis]
MLVIPIYNTIILPDVQYNLEPDSLTDREKSTLKVEDTVILLPLKEEKTREELRAEDFYPIGLTGVIKGIRNADGDLIMAVRTEIKVKVVNLVANREVLNAEYEIIYDEADIDEREQRAVFNMVLENLAQISSYFQWGSWAMRFSEKLDNVNEVISIVGPYTDLTVEEKYAMLETDSLMERYHLISEAMLKYRDLVELQVDINKKIQDKQGDNYRESMIRRQIELLNDELSEYNQDELSDVKRLESKIEEAGFPEEVKVEIDRVFNKFRQMGSDDHEYGSTLEYLEFVTALSWKPEEEQEIDIKKAKEILNKSHHGLKKPKERVTEQIAVMALKKQNAGSIILFTGAPGTGKTSMGKAIAEALGRKYIRISLGGIKDEAEIRGHRRTYVGAMPGRIMESIKRSGVNNPVIVLDEIDKLGYGSFNGDPESALLEVLDPEQNVTFTDHYMNVPYDLSKVLFICTANSIDEMSEPLLDRMEIIELSGYTAEEKFHIAKEHLMSKSLEETGLLRKNIGISDSVLKNIIANYTMEAGVRGLKKQIDKLMRQAAVKILEKEVEKVVIKKGDLPKLLGNKKALHDKVLKHNIPGVVTGLAWTQAGGEILFIETTAFAGTGQIVITGQLGDVMKESATIAVNLVKSLLFDKKIDFRDKDIHIHVPSGSVPKDGPSAGITMFTAIISLVLGIKVDSLLAMTGEISLRGQVLPIGGLPEKLMAAERAGIKKVLIPLSNKEDLIDVPESTKKSLEIVLVDTVTDVAKEALGLSFYPNNKGFFKEINKKIKNEDKEKVVIPVKRKNKNSDFIAN